MVQDNPCFNEIIVVDVNEVKLIIVGKKQQMPLLFVKLAESFFTGVLIGELFGETTFFGLEVVRS